MTGRGGAGWLGLVMAGLGWAAVGQVITGRGGQGGREVGAGLGGW